MQINIHAPTNVASVRCLFTQLNFIILFCRKTVLFRYTWYSFSLQIRYVLFVLCVFYILFFHLHFSLFSQKLYTTFLRSFTSNITFQHCIFLFLILFYITLQTLYIILGRFISTHFYHHFFYNNLERDDSSSLAQLALQEIHAGRKFYNYVVNILSLQAQLQDIFLLSKLWQQLCRNSTKNNSSNI